LRNLLSPARLSSSQDVGRDYALSQRWLTPFACVSGSHCGQKGGNYHHRLRLAKPAANVSRLPGRIYSAIVRGIEHIEYSLANMVVVYSKARIPAMGLERYRDKVVTELYPHICVWPITGSITQLRSMDVKNLVSSSPFQFVDYDGD